MSLIKPSFHAGADRLFRSFRNLSAIAALIGCADVGCARVSNGGTVDAAPPPPSSKDAAAPGTDVGAPASDAPAAPPGGCTTALTGTAYAPNGTLPLYNVSVYVPSAPLAPFTQGVTCDRCGGTTVHAVAATVSDEHGRFRITNVPAGKDVPLVFQVGKWRRKVTVPTVLACQDNPIADPNLTRLPRNRQEGDMPRIALTTGGCDLLGCLLPKIGVDTAELGVAGEGKAVTFYEGSQSSPTSVPAGVPAGYHLILPELGPPRMTAAETLWRNESELAKYDLTLLSCECEEHTMNKGPAAYDAMTKYLAHGGRIFSTDYMYLWYRYSQDPSLAGAMSITGMAREAKGPMVIDTSFPKGRALADWMKFLDPTITYGQIASDVVFANIDSAMPSTVQVWATSPTPQSTNPGPRIVSVNTPVGVPADQQCGRAIHLDAHIVPVSQTRVERDGADAGMPGFKFPQDCGTKLNKGEESLAFLLFDLAACVQNDGKPVAPPIIIP